MPVIEPWIRPGITARGVDNPMTYSLCSRAGLSFSPFCLLVGDTVRINLGLAIPTQGYLVLKLSFTLSTPSDLLIYPSLIPSLRLASEI